MITDFNCDKAYFSALLPKVAPVAFKELTAAFDKHNVSYSLLEGTRDIWCRDYMPIQVAEKRFAEYLYDPDYLQGTKKDRESITNGGSVARELGFELDDNLRDIRIDGGNVVRCDGKVIMTAKVFEENPGYTVRKLSALLEEGFGAEVIFVPWDTEEYFGHADGICRYIGGDRVLMTNYRDIDEDMADRFYDCLKPHFKEVIELEYNVARPCDYNWAYINWLQTDKVIILPSFGVPEDEQVREQLELIMPEYRGRIEAVDAHDLIVHEGCFNCASWTIRAASKNL